MKKDIWRKNFEITRTHLQMATPALYDMMVLQKPTTGKQILNEGVWLMKGYNNVGTYFKDKELRAIIERTLEVIITNPKKIHQVHQKALKFNQDLFKLAKEYYKTDFSKYSNQKLGQAYNKIIKLFINGHGYALPTTWFLDSDGEDFSKILQETLDTIILEKNLEISPAEAFIILTTPTKQSLAVKEEVELIKIALMIKENLKVKNFFLKSSTKKIIDNLGKLDKSITRKINNHFNKWRWQSYTYMGPAYELDYYLEVWQGLIKQKINLKAELNRLLKQADQVKKSKQQLIKKLKFSNQEKSLFKTAEDIIYLKSYRKDAWFFTCYALENLYKEIGKRLGLSLNQVWFMVWWEVEPALTKGNFPLNIVNQRMKSCVYYQKGLKGYLYTGRQAKEFLSKIKFEKVKTLSKASELRGTCAYPGKAKGVVKIINQVEDIGKMSQGDIMLAHTTYPALVPAMRKASAIVTDDGGVTCHAAIVARELKIPSIVGTKIATKVFKDGDRVEVDATNGIVKKI